MVALAARVGGTRLIDNIILGQGLDAVTAASRAALVGGGRRPSAAAHIERVAALADGWAERMRVSEAERERWLRAVWLHDALRDARRRARPLGGGRAGPGVAPARARQRGAGGGRGRDRSGDSRRRALPFGRAGRTGTWSGRVLYCADYLEPGRAFRREWRAALADRFPDDPAGVLSRGGRRPAGTSHRLGLAAHRPHGALLEQPRRALRLALIAALAVAIAGVVALMLPARARARRRPCLRRFRLPGRRIRWRC